VSILLYLNFKLIKKNLNSNKFSIHLTISSAKIKLTSLIFQDAGEKLKNKYVLMRSGAKAIEDDTEKRLSIPITVRQLEAIIRIAESMAKMELTPFAVDRHIEEALRLFQVQFQFSIFFIFTTTMLGITSSNVRDHFTL
jgi:DNA replicative helicase MCM subunit Mcm2 (Cdc46/Mcm family)